MSRIKDEELYLTVGQNGSVLGETKKLNGTLECIIVEPDDKNIRGIMEISFRGFIIYQTNQIALDIIYPAVQPTRFDGREFSFGTTKYTLNDSLKILIRSVPGDKFTVTVRYSRGD